jgi:cytoskeletal protein CcmA (bactofilin family)
MWRKPTDGKQSSQSSNTPGPAVQVPPAAAKPIEPIPVETKPVAVEKPVVQAPPPPAPVATAYVPPPPVARDRGAASIITSGIKIRGEVSGSADLVIEGELQGKISLTSAKVTVGSSGRVQADIEANDILVEGSLTGNLKAKDSLRLGASSRVEGSILTPRVAIEDGARLRGKVEMVRAGESRNSAAPSTAAATETKGALHAAAK